MRTKKEVIEEKILKRVELRVSEELHDILRKISYETRESINAIINSALLEKFLDEFPKKALKK